jgi:site-specific recombinase XerD
MPGVDTKTRFTGVYARHQQGCAIERDRRCNCKPSFFGVAYDRVERKHRKTPRRALAGDARDDRRDLLVELDKGTVSRGAPISLEVGFKEFMKAVRDGVALNKWRRRYRPRAADDLESAFKHVPADLRRRKVRDIRRGDIQRLADSLSGKLSRSRVSGVIHGLSAFYNWAEDRELASGSPTDGIKLPAKDETPRDHVATPDEFVALLEALFLPTPKEEAQEIVRDPAEALRDAVPYALAGYGTARHQEIAVLDWLHIGFEVRAGEIAADEEGRKPGGSWRVVPFVDPLWQIVYLEWISQGRPKRGKVVRPRTNSKSGKAAVANIQERVHRRWRALELTPIGLQEARHTAATWLDHALISPKVASQIMGHKTPEYQPGAARITLERYTHVLPGELERARDQLDAFLRERSGVSSILSEMFERAEAEGSDGGLVPPAVPPGPDRP